jgi:hypothetical protein
LSGTGVVKASVGACEAGGKIGDTPVLEGVATIEDADLRTYLIRNGVLVLIIP